MPNLISHRGFHNNEIKENTLRSITKAFEQGFNGVEFDVRSTKDGVLVLSHDPNLLRVHGADLMIAENNFADLKSKCSELTTLDEVFEKFKDKQLLVEIKDRKSFEIINKYQNLGPNIKMQSFHWDELIKLAKETSFMCGLLMPSYTKSLTALFIFLRFLFWKKLKANGIKFLSLPTQLLIGNVVNQARRNGIDLYVWTVTDAKTLQDLQNKGVENLISEIK